MAIREACELYIEQEIKSSLAAGKKPWTIGKGLSKWVEKLFEVTINPQTIARRASRISTNVEKKPKIEANPTRYRQPVHSQNSVTSPVTARGGLRTPAGGRPARQRPLLAVGEIPYEEVISRSFKVAYNMMEAEILNAKLTGWGSTSQETARRYLETLTGLID